MPNPTTRPVFDSLFAAAERRIRAGDHSRDEPPVEGGRWPVTVVARPPLHIRRRLELLMAEVIEWAGPAHFRTGLDDAVHITIRALEPYREAARREDPITSQWRAAMRRTAAVSEPLQLSFTGLTLAPGSVMAQLEPLDHRPWELLDTLRTNLAELAWFEDQWLRRNIWYCNLLHFADAISDPIGLIEWARERRDLAPSTFTIGTMELVRFAYTSGPHGRYLRPETWFTAALGTGHRGAIR